MTETERIEREYWNAVITGEVADLRTRQRRRRLIRRAIDIALSTSIAILHAACLGLGIAGVLSGDAWSLMLIAFFVPATVFSARFWIDVVKGNL
jgi:hypothetical protein